MAQMTWRPDVYEKFGDERSRPFFDLVNRIGCESPRHVVDLGCGPGTLTASLADRWPEAQVLGIDSSDAMIAEAEQLPHADGRLTFTRGDIAEFTPAADLDVLVSNAALQWVEGHRGFLARWANAMPSGSWLAFQVPGNFRSPSHVLMRELAESASWRGKVGGILRHEDAVGDPVDYLNDLLDLGWQAEAWETTYEHVLQGEDPVLEWTRGTGLRPVLAALSPSEAAAFEADYAASLREAYPPGNHGTIYPFRRIFAVAHRP